MNTIEPSISNSPNPRTPTTPSDSPSGDTVGTAVVKAFFAAFGRGDLEGIVRLFHPTSRVVAVRAGVRRPGQVHGSYAGHAGVSEFIHNIGNTFEPQAFSVQDVVGAGAVVFANGTLTHRLKSTGKLFSSEWALRCVQEAGQITDFHFYEDSAALVAADPSLAA